MTVLLLFVMLLGINGPSQANDDTPVDIELVLAVDLSLSMTPEELEIQRAGYAAALRDSAVVSAMLSGLYGRVALTFVEWAGVREQAVVVPWQQITSAEDANLFADRIVAQRRNGWRRTSLSGALAFSASLFDDNGIRSIRRIIDISGDGPNNDGPAVTSARDAAVDSGIVVNGLPLMTRIGLMGLFEIDDLDVYYEECVIGGAGAFVVPVYSWDQFADAVRRKLVLELSDRPADWNRERTEPQLVSFVQMASAYDCLIGEKLWEKQFGR